MKRLDAMTAFPRETESDQLRYSWERHSAATLDTYLVSGVEDPRINVQSILTRALINDALFPGRFSRLIDEELRFGFVMTWLLTHLKLGIDKSQILAAIRQNDRERCPSFVIDAFRMLQAAESVIPDYVTTALQDADRNGATALSSEAIDTFRSIWHQQLGAMSHPGYSLFEPACGSANDYRYLNAYGLTKLVRYTGLDLAPTNITNALHRFPNADFRVGDLLHNRLHDAAFDYAFVHDLFEHLSTAAIERALRELLRVTRREVWLHLFHAADVPCHNVQPVATYHWNVLSICEIVRVCSESASRVDVVSIAELAWHKFGFGRYYNPGACTIVAVKETADPTNCGHGP